MKRYREEPEKLIDMIEDPNGKWVRHEEVKDTFTVKEIKNYITSQLAGDIAYNCTAENIRKANRKQL